jgi:hypothetical protein
MVADIDPIELGTVTVQFDKFLSSAIETKEAKVFFDPRINAVYLTFKYQSLNYLQYWDKPNRDAFIAAFERYQTDYDAKALLTKDSNSRAIYGEVKGMTTWSTLSASFSERATSYPKINIGYTFKKNSSEQPAPYFSVLQLEANAEKNENGGDQSSKTSLRIRMYYTLAQAESLMAYFDDAYLMGRVRDFAKPIGAILTSDDDYNSEETPAPQIQADETDQPAVEVVETTP